MKELGYRFKQCHPCHTRKVQYNRQLFALLTDNHNFIFVALPKESEVSMDRYSSTYILSNIIHLGRYNSTSTSISTQLCSGNSSRSILFWKEIPWDEILEVFQTSSSPVHCSYIYNSECFTILSV